MDLEWTNHDSYYTAWMNGLTPEFRQFGKNGTGGPDHDQYCQQIEAEIRERGETAIVWGNGDAIRNDIAQISGKPISFEVHYRIPTND